MSKLPFIKILCVVVVALVSFGAWALFLCSESERAGDKLPINKASVFRMAVQVPSGTYPVGSRENGCYPPREATLDAFYIWPTEVPAAWWAVFRNESSGEKGDMPAAHMTHDEAVSFCQWFSDRYGIRARLPTRQEWQTAARCGKGGVTYSWGWGKPGLRDREQWVRPVRSGQNNPWGLYHMSGNMAEWCAAGEGESTAPVLGGSWAERDPKFLRVSHRLMLPKNYRDADVGFRLVIETSEKETVASAKRIGE